jgi:hypothetical protein
MKKLMLYLTEEEYEFIRQEAFKGGEKLSGYVKGCVFKSGKEDKKISKVESTVKVDTGRCKVCGMMLNTYGLCNNSAKHK